MLRLEWFFWTKEAGESEEEMLTEGEIEALMVLESSLDGSGKHPRRKSLAYNAHTTPAL